MELPDKIISEIAGQLDSGLIFYIHKETKEVKRLPDDQMYEASDEKLWEAELKEIDDNFDKYIQIDSMSSRESYKLMEAFTDEVKNENIRMRLINALERRRPFHNFRYELDYFGDLLDQWYDFKQKQYEKWIREQLEDE